MDRKDRDRFRYHNFPLQDNLFREPVSSKVKKANLLLNHFKRVSLQKPMKREKSTLPKTINGPILSQSLDKRNHSLQYERSAQEIRTNSSVQNISPLKNGNAYNLASNSHKQILVTRFTNPTTKSKDSNKDSNPLTNPYSANDE